jgi:hypothetical protein
VLIPNFSLHHVASPEEGCALPALSTEIVRIGIEAGGAVIVECSLASENGKQMLLQSAADFMKWALKTEVRENRPARVGMRANGSRAWL